MFWPHTKCPKHLKNFSNKIFVKNAQNVGIYQWNIFEVTHVYVPYKMAKTLVKIQTKFLSKMLKMAKILVKIFIQNFVKNAQNVEIYQWNVFEVTHVLSP